MMPRTGHRTIDFGDRVRITRIGVYFYHRRFTLAFTWKVRWRWLPWKDTDLGCNGGWALGWGWWMLKKNTFGPDDDWGVKQAEVRAWMLERLLSDEPLFPRQERKSYGPQYGSSPSTACPACGKRT